MVPHASMAGVSTNPHAYYRRSQSFASSLCSSGSSGDAPAATLLRFDDEEDWPAPAHGLLDNGRFEDPYGTRHLESPGSFYAPSFWSPQLQHLHRVDSPPTLDLDGPFPCARLGRVAPLAHAQAASCPPTRPSSSLPPTAAFDTFQRSSSSVWWQNGRLEERPPSPFLAAGQSTLISPRTKIAPLPSPPPSAATFPLPVPPTTGSMSISPLSTPFRSRFLSLEIAPTLDERQEEDTALARYHYPPVSSPMMRSPSLPTAYAVPTPATVLQHGISPRYKRALKGSPKKARSPATEIRRESPNQEPLEDPSVKRYKGGKGMHSCVGCRKGRAKCIGAKPPPFGRGGVSDQRCQRCVERNIQQCTFETLRTRGPSHKAPAPRPSSTRRGEGKLPGLVRLKPHRRSHSLDVVPTVLAAASFKPNWTANLSERVKLAKEAEQDEGAETDEDMFEPLPPSTVEHTFIPDPRGDFPSYHPQAPFHTTSSLGLFEVAADTVLPPQLYLPMLFQPLHISPPPPRVTPELGLYDPFDLRFHSALPADGQRTVLSSAGSSGSDADDGPSLPISPPLNQGPLAIRFDEQGFYPQPSQLSQALSLTAVNKEPASAHLAVQPSSADEQDNRVHHQLAAFSSPASLLLVADGMPPFAALSF